MSNGDAKAVRAFPGATESTFRCLWSNAFMERKGFVVRKENAKKLPPSCEEPKESYDIFDGGGEQLA